MILHTLGGRDKGGSGAEMQSSGTMWNIQYIVRPGLKTWESNVGLGGN